jgi:viroplasmin and RNaseH domain-containing protein
MMDLLNEIEKEINGTINVLRKIESLEYRQKISKETHAKEVKDTTEMLKSILKTKQNLINQEKILFINNNLQKYI